MGGEVLAVVRSGLYLDFRFLDMALSALSPTPDERCGVLATDGRILCYQPSALLRLYKEKPEIPQPPVPYTRCSTASSATCGPKGGGTSACGTWPVISRWKMSSTGWAAKAFSAR